MTSVKNFAEKVSRGDLTQKVDFVDLERSTKILQKLNKTKDSATVLAVLRGCI